jgi:hypothetical protein
MYIFHFNKVTLNEPFDIGQKTLICNIIYYYRILYYLSKIEREITLLYYIHYRLIL